MKNFRNLVFIFCVLFVFIRIYRQKPKPLKLKETWKISLLVASSLVGFIPEKSNSHEFTFPNSNVRIERAVLGKPTIKPSPAPSPAPSKATAALVSPPISTGRNRNKLTLPAQTSLANNPVRAFQPYKPYAFKTLEFRGLEAKRAKKNIIANDKGKGKPFDKSFSFEEFEKKLNQTKVEEDYKYVSVESYVKEKQDIRRKKKKEEEKVEIEINQEIDQKKKIKVSEWDVSKYLKKSKKGSEWEISKVLKEMKMKENEKQIKMSEWDVSKYLKETKKQIVYRIHESNPLLTEADKTLRNQDVARQVQSLINQLEAGSMSPGSGSKKINELTNTFEARSDGGARVYHRFEQSKVIILGISSKENQDAVIDKLGDMEKANKNP